MEHRISHRSAGKSFSALISLAILGMAAVLFYLVQSGRIAKGNPICAVCQRPLHPAQTFVVVSQGSQELRTCCPRCGLHYVLERGAKAGSATDFTSGRLIDAAGAFYLEGSDLMQCCASTTMRTESGMICDMHYDRCMPSLVAFGSLQNAESYQQEHGGHVLSLAEARASVEKQMSK